MYVCICMHVYVCMYMYPCICMYVCVYVCVYMYACMYVCICVYAYMYMYVCIIYVGNCPGGNVLPKTRGGIVRGGIVLHPSACVVSSSLWASSSIRSISSANARLLILVPLIFIPPSLSLILSSILSYTSMKVFGDIGFPCLVPLLVANHSPSSFPILTAAVAFPFISLSSCVNFLSTPYESIAADVMF